MNLPSGLVFFLDFQYGTTKTPFTSGDSLYGNRSATGQFPFQTTGTTGGLYGTGRFTYSTNQTSSANITVTAFSASWQEVGFDSTLSASIVANQIKKLTVSNASTILTDFDSDAVRGFVLSSGSAVTVATNYPAFTVYNGPVANSISFFVTASTATIPALGVFTVNYQKTTADNERGDFEDTPSPSYSVPNAQDASTIVIPEINIKMQSQAITAKTKKLKAVWTPEFAQDLNAYQNIDAEAELTNIMSEYISMEIDLEILDMLIEDAAAATEYWSTVSNEFINATATGFTQLSATTGGYYNTQGQWFQTLGTKMQKVSNKIHQLTSQPPCASEQSLWHSYPYTYQGGLHLALVSEPVVQTPVLLHRLQLR